MKLYLLAVAITTVFTQTTLAHNTQTQLTVTAKNKLNISRPNETLELTGQVVATLAEKDLMKPHVFDSSGKEILSQAVDTDYDDYHKPDILIYQAEFAERLRSPMELTVK